MLRELLLGPCLGGRSLCSPKVRVELLPLSVTVVGPVVPLCVLIALRYMHIPGPWHSQVSEEIPRRGTEKILQSHAAPGHSLEPSTHASGPPTWVKLREMLAELPPWVGTTPRGSQDHCRSLGAQSLAALDEAGSDVRRWGSGAKKGLLQGLAW
ncbi:unnamed protein product [Rangifer tarandus platyrhynchus]|uniref:Uncharacterized protein n=1 Tax=Rangifer tarandus platyrhynchus TaxID=3082113 RepID=A0ABN8YTP6_RANTA|nr:unnamed protein product [Rangifer tarandus platyrhynchus]